MDFELDPKLRLNRLSGISEELSLACIPHSASASLIVLLLQFALSPSRHGRPDLRVNRRLPRGYQPFLIVFRENAIIPAHCDNFVIRIVLISGDSLRTTLLASTRDPECAFLVSRERGWLCRGILAPTSFPTRSKPYSIHRLEAEGFQAKTLRLLRSRSQISVSHQSGDSAGQHRCA